MVKKAMGKYCFVYPVPTVILGSTINGKANFSTIGNCGIISMHPATVYVSTDIHHYTNIGIKETNMFSVNFPSQDSIIKTDYCGLVSGRNKDKSQVFQVFYGESIYAPMIEECPVCLECNVINHQTINGMDVFIGEVIQSYIDEKCLVNGIPDAELIDPIIYTMKGKYRKIGEETGIPFSDGRKYVD